MMLLLLFAVGTFAGNDEPSYNVIHDPMLPLEPGEEGMKDDTVPKGFDKWAKKMLKQDMDQHKRLFKALKTEEHHTEEEHEPQPGLIDGDIMVPTPAELAEPDVEFPAKLLGMSTLTKQMQSSKDDAEDPTDFDGHKVVHGDDLDGPAEPKGVQMVRSASRAVTSSVRPWSNQEMPYDYDPATVANHPERVARIQEAIRQLSAKTCIRFFKVTSATAGRPHAVFHWTANECSSFVGMVFHMRSSRRGVHPINLANRCSVGSVIHEIMHLLGFHHEHNRFDREDFVQHNGGSQFNRINNPHASDRSHMYDYMSVMHYSRFQTVRGATFRQFFTLLGQRNGLSTMDALQINELYKCDHKANFFTTVMVTKKSGGDDQFTGRYYKMEMHDMNDRNMYWNRDKRVYAAWNGEAWILDRDANFHRNAETKTQTNGAVKARATGNIQFSAAQFDDYRVALDTAGAPAPTPPSPAPRTPRPTPRAPAPATKTSPVTPSPVVSGRPTPSPAGYTKHPKGMFATTYRYKGYTRHANDAETAMSICDQDSGCGGVLSVCRGGAGTSCGMWTLCGKQGMRVVRLSSRSNVDTQLFTKKTGGGGAPPPITIATTPRPTPTRTTTTTTTTTTTRTSTSCRTERGFCIDRNGRDVNRGVTKYPSSANWSMTDCYSACLRTKRQRSITACEYIKNQGNRGCYYHTQPVERGNNRVNHYCWVMKKCTTSGRGADSVMEGGEEMFHNQVAMYAVVAFVMMMVVFAFVKFMKTKNDQYDEIEDEASPLIAA